jgi:Zn-dependent protease with chaperone function
MLSEEIKASAGTTAGATAAVAPPRENAVYLDGRTNRKRRVMLRSAAAGLDIIEQGAVVEVWPYGDIRRADGPPDVLRLSCIASLPLARLEIEDAATKAAVIASCPSLNVDRGGGQTGRIVFWSLAAVASIVTLAVFGIPVVAERLAPMLPASLERRIGEAVDKQVHFIFRGEVCTGAEGQAAFTALVDKLKQAGGMDVPFEAHVVSSPVPNAFALPGGKIYLLNGLLQKAQSPDEVAGILAHEMGHVQHRDNLKRIIQTGGTSFLVGLLFGDVTGAGAVIFVSRSMLDASYSRDSERAADAFAVEVMHKLGRSPKPMGELLFRITGAEATKSITILAGHPLTEDRRAAMKAQDRPATGADILSAAQWRALKNICKSS